MEQARFRLGNGANADRRKIVALLPKAKSPNDGRLSALSHRGGGGAGAGMQAIPSAPTPGFDAVINIGATIALLWYWWTFFRGARRSAPEKPAP
jgi:hypothetical protein